MLAPVAAPGMSLRGAWITRIATLQGRGSIWILYVHLKGLMYTTYMSTTEPLNITEARKRLAAIIDQAHTEHEPVYLTRRGRRVAAVIDADDLEGILELAEDMADIRAAEAARAEMKATGEKPIPWDEVKADLGLV